MSHLDVRHGQPTHTPPAGSEASAAAMDPARSMSATGSTSVIPYGVCNSASGVRRSTSAAVRQRSAAPAESTRPDRSERVDELLASRGRGDHVRERGG